MAGAAQVASLYGVLSLKDEMTGALGKVDKKLTGMEKGLGSAAKTVSKFGDGLTRVGTTLAPIAAGFSVIGYSSLNVAADFENAMAEISARTGLVGDDLEMISDFALQMGQDTLFSANEAAEGFLQLLSSGQSATEAIATLGTVLDLAAASGEDLGFTADALTDIMAQFGLGIEDATEVSDALARAAGASSAEIRDLADGFANVGPVAHQYGLDVNDTAAALAILAENGIKGAEGGTALKSMLINMTRPTDDVRQAWEDLGTAFYDADGNARPLNDVLADIKEGLEGMPAEEQNRLMTQLAGTYGVVALTALLGDISINDMKESMAEQASAADVAQQMTDTFSGKVDDLKGSLETLQIRAMTPFMDSLGDLALQLSPIVDALADWAAENPKTTTTILAVAAGIVIFTAATLILGPIIAAVGGALGLLTTAFFLLGGAVGIVGILLAAYATNFGGFRDAIHDIQEAFKEGDIVGILEGIGTALLAIPLGLAGLFVDTDKLDAWVGIWDNLKTIISALPGYIADVITKNAEEFVTDTLEAYKAIWSLIKNTVVWLAQNVAEMIGSISFDMPKSLTDLLDLIQAVVDAAKSAYDWITSLGGLDIPSPGDIVSGATDFVGGALGLRQGGGVGYAGHAYRTHENELFVPGETGRFFTPAQQRATDSSGGGPQTIIVQVDSNVLFEAVIGEGARRNEVVWVS